MKSVIKVTVCACAALLLGSPVMAQLPIGSTGDIQVIGDFDGDGLLDYAVWRPATATFMVQLTAGFNGTTYVEEQLGLPGDIPVVGNYSGSVNATTGLPMTDYAVWRPSTGYWYYAASTPGSAVNSVQWGLPGDIPIVGDFDGDKRTDFVVWRPSDQTWWLKLSSNPTPLEFQWGLPGDVPVTGDFDNSGKSEMAVWRPSNGVWYVISGKDGSNFTQQWGLPGDIPYAADFDGDGITDYAVWRPSEGNLYVSPSATPAFRVQSRPPNELVDSTKFYVGPSGVAGSLGKGVFVQVKGSFHGPNGTPDFALFDAGLDPNSSDPNVGNWYVLGSPAHSSPIEQHWGDAGDIPLAGDYDGDGQTDFAVWRPSSATYLIIPSATPSSPIDRQWGLPGDIPVVGDYDGDGKVDMVVWRPSNAVWYCILTTAGLVVGNWGLPGDVPLSADFDGDQKSDLTVWRPSTGVWWIKLSTTSATQALQFGDSGIDLPIGGDFDNDGKSDYAVWRPTDQSYHFIPSTNPGIESQVPLGVAGNAFVYNVPPITTFIGPR